MKEILQRVLLRVANKLYGQLSLQFQSKQFFLDYCVEKGISYEVSENIIALDLQRLGYDTKCYFRNQGSDLGLFKHIFIRKEYQGLVDLINHFCQQDRIATIFDCGSNIGLATVFFTSLYPSARIHAFEPEDENFDLLTRNTNGLSGVHRNKLGIYGADTTLEIDRSFRHSDASSIRLEEAEHGSIEVRRLSQYLEEHEISQVDILKMDIEGSEESIFKNPDEVEAVLPKVRFLAIEIHPEVADEEHILKTLRSYSFTTSRHGELYLCVNHRLVENSLH